MIKKNIQFLKKYKKNIYVMKFKFYIYDKKNNLFWFNMYYNFLFVFYL